MTAAEEWRAVPGFPDYKVSDLGRVMSFRSKRPRILAGFRNTGGYRQVALMRERRRHQVLLHRLVLEAFCGPCPDGLQTRHLNGDQLDNRLKNLLYGTPSENVADTVRLGTHHLARRDRCARSHVYDETNTRWTGGRRWCRTCDRIRQTESRNRRALAAANVPVSTAA